MLQFHLAAEVAERPVPAVRLRLLWVGYIDFDRDTDLDATTKAAEVFRMILAGAALMIASLGTHANPAAAASAPASATSFGNMTMSPKSEQSDKLVLKLSDVQAWSTAVRQAGRSVVVRDDSVTGRPHCIDVTLYEDAGAYLHRFGTWRVCGSAVRRLPDD